MVFKRLYTWFLHPIISAVSVLSFAQHPTTLTIIFSFSSLYKQYMTSPPPCLIKGVGKASLWASIGCETPLPVIMPLPNSVFPWLSIQVRNSWSQAVCRTARTLLISLISDSFLIPFPYWTWSVFLLDSRKFHMESLCSVLFLECLPYHFSISGYCSACLAQNTLALSQPN